MNLPNFSYPVWPFSATLNRSFRIGFAAMLLSYYCAGAEAQSRLDWKNVPFVRVPTENVARLANEANSALINKEYDVAISRCMKALQLGPDKKMTVLIYNVLSGAHAGKHLSAQAMKDAEAAIRIDPSSPWGYIARGLVIASSGKYRLAIEDFDKAIRCDPKNAIAFNNRGASFDFLGDIDHAFADYSQAIRLNPRRGDALVNRAELYLQKHDYRAALANLESAVAHENKQNGPDYRYMLNALAWFKAVCPDPAFRDGKKAVELSTKACELDHWRDARYVDTLAAAYAECGDFDQAIRFQTQAVKLKSSGDGPSQKERDASEEERRQHLRLYQNHKPYRDDFKRNY
jgi:tetratricopeptide (TPR) repeat protein